VNFEVEYRQDLSLNSDIAKSSPPTHGPTPPHNNAESGLNPKDSHKNVTSTRPTADFTCMDMNYRSNKHAQKSAPESPPQIIQQDCESLVTPSCPDIE
jgi:hypothetical protein